MFENSIPHDTASIPQTLGVYCRARLGNCGEDVSANPLIFNRSAVFKKDGSCSWLMFTSPLYINSKIACKCV